MAAFIVLFCGVVTPGLWVGWYCLRRWPQPDLQPLSPLLLASAIVYTGFMVPFLSAELIWERRTDAAVTLAAGHVRLPRRFRPPVDVPYASIVDVETGSIRAGHATLKALVVRHPAGVTRLPAVCLGGPRVVEGIVRELLARRDAARGIDVQPEGDRLEQPGSSNPKRAR